MSETFSKPALSLDEQVNLLISRGLSIPDAEHAKRYLRFIGYYRLSGYALPFQVGNNTDGQHKFKPGTTFDTILGLYIFDRKLRLLVMDALERIEVALRAAISNAMSEKHGPHWFMDGNHFQPRFNHKDFLDVVKRNIAHDSAKAHGRHTFIQHYYSKYGDPELPPSWMIFEVLSFGTVSQIFKYLNLPDQKQVASMFGLHYDVMASWLHAISYLRNLCAHHARMWNRTFTIKPMQAKKYAEHLTLNHRFYAQAVVIQIFLKTIAGDSHWTGRLATLLAEHPNISPKTMGFPEQWHEQALWKAKVG